MKRRTLPRVERGAAGRAGRGGRVVPEELDAMLAELLANLVILDTKQTGLFVLVRRRRSFLVRGDDEEVGALASNRHVTTS